MPRIRSHFDAGFPAAAISRANQKFATIDATGNITKGGFHQA